MLQDIDLQYVGGVPTFGGPAAATALAATGLTGATAATRYAGGTASGAPVSGTFAVGDFVIDQTGKVWVCTAAGSPGTWAQAGGGGGGAVSSVFTRTGAVVAASGDYTVAQVTGAAPLASPALTGTPTSPTAAALTSSTQLATTAYADTAVGVETTRATTAEALKAPLASPALTGSPTAPTQISTDNTTKLATTAYVTGAVGTEATRATAAEGASSALITARSLIPTPVKTANYTAVAGDFVLVDATSGPITITAPALVAGARWGIRLTTAVANAVTASTGSGVFDTNNAATLAFATGTGTALVDTTWAANSAATKWVGTSSGKPNSYLATLFSALQPYQFMPESYGAKADGRIVGDGAMTTGTATLTSATATFTSGDVGKNIVVNGALGASSAPLYTTILTFTNSTTVVLNANATNTVSSAAVFWASDDSAAIVSAITAASTYAQANNFKAQVIFQPKSYGLATLTTTTAGGSLANQNALVPIPYPNVNGTTRKLSFELVGVGENADQQYFNSTVPCMSGTCLVATVAASGTNPSIIGGPYDSTNLSGTWANTKGVIKGISVWAGFNPGWIAYGLNQLASCWVDNCCANVLAPQAAGQAPIATTIPANGSGVGLWMAANNDCGAGRFLEMGYYKGVNLSTRNTIEKLFTSASVHGAFAQTVNGSVIHSARIGYWACQGVTNGITSTGTSGTMGLVVDMYDSTSTVTTDLNDPHGTLVGNVNWYHDVSTTPAVTAGFAMKFTNMRLNPGPIASPPAAPTSGSASTAIFRDTAVTLSVTGGTLTALLIDSVDQHIPASCVLWRITLPSGHTYTPTYTGALATDVTVM